MYVCVSYKVLQGTSIRVSELQNTISYFIFICLLFFPGVFAPTIFSKIYGTLQCRHCEPIAGNVTGDDNSTNVTAGFQCSSCEQSVVSTTTLHLYLGNIAVTCSVRGARCSSVVRAFSHGAMGHLIDPSWGGPIELFLVPARLHDWCNKGHGMCYPVCGMVHIKEPLLLIGKSSPCGGSRFPLSLSERSFDI